MADWSELKTEWGGQLVYARLMGIGALSLGGVLLISAGQLRQLRRAGADAEHYVRPPRQYDLPAYEPGMQVCHANERYLRPTRYCNYRESTVVAMAHSLGAFRKPDREYAQAAFTFAKEQLNLEIMPIDGVSETIRRGTGTCFHLISVFVALCRAAGIKARYKIFSTTMIESWRHNIVDVDPLVRKWYDSIGYFMLEGEGEAYVDGRWQVAHVGPTAERQASAGIPITRFGEDAIGVWFFARSGTIMRLEAIPLGMGPASRLLKRISPASMERVSLGAQRQHELGRRILAEAGGPAAYDERVRREREGDGPRIVLEPREEIVFGG